jgi:plasmid stabilization system protein ParE
MVIWSIPAKHDLKKIHDYIVEDSKYYALKVSQEFVVKSEALLDFPKMGKSSSRNWGSEHTRIDYLFVSSNL